MIYRWKLSSTSGAKQKPIPRTVYNFNAIHISTWPTNVFANLVNFSLREKTGSICNKSMKLASNSWEICDHWKKNYLAFKDYNNKLQRECNIVTGMETMPNCQENQCAQLTVVAIAEESQTFVYIFGCPMVGLHIKTVNIMLESSCILEH